MIAARHSLVILSLVAVPTVTLAEESHPPLPPSVEAFHDIISKDWHAPEGPERLKSACANVPAYAAASKRVADDKAPEGVDGGQWTPAASALGGASAQLGQSCASNDDASVTASLAALHDRFHDIVKLIMHK